MIQTAHTTVYNMPEESSASNLMSALRYNSKHLNDDSTPKGVKNMVLAAWSPLVIFLLSFSDAVLSTSNNIAADLTHGYQHDGNKTLTILRQSRQGSNPTPSYTTSTSIYNLVFSTLVIHHPSSSYLSIFLLLPLFLLYIVVFPSSFFFSSFSSFAVLLH